MFINFYKCVGF